MYGPIAIKKYHLNTGHPIDTDIGILAVWPTDYGTTVRFLKMTILRVKVGKKYILSTIVRGPDGETVSIGWPVFALFFYIATCL